MARRSETIEDPERGYNGRVSRAALLEAGQIITTQFLRNLPTLAAA